MMLPGETRFGGEAKLGQGTEYKAGVKGLRLSAVGGLGEGDWKRRREGGVVVGTGRYREGGGEKRNRGRENHRNREMRGDGAVVEGGGGVAVRLGGVSTT